MTNAKPELLVAPCSYQAVKYAVEHWHYSQTMPAGKLVKFGVWEDGTFIGVVVFGRGAIYHIGSPYQLEQDQCVELVRIALTNHCTPVSRIVSQMLRQLKTTNPGLRLVISYADQSKGHVGAVYQAMNWIYTSYTKQEPEILLNGKSMHRRSIHSKYGTYAMEWLRNYVDPNACYTGHTIKHKYLYPLDRAMRRQIAPLAQPYPKRDDMRATNGSTLATSEGVAVQSRPVRLKGSKRDGQTE